RRLERLFREGRLFTFCDPALLGKGPVERNTNRLEGGVNSLIKRTLARHHGLTEEHMRRAAEWVCYMKSGSPDPHTLIPDTGGEHGTDAPAVQDEPETGSDYDNGIQSYNRDDPAVETGFHIRKGHVG
ncbi:IS256 family transposase, partial [Bifidobacterium apri]